MEEPKNGRSYMGSGGSKENEVSSSLLDRCEGWKYVVEACKSKY